MAQGQIKSGENRIAAILARNIGDLEDEIWQLQQDWNEVDDRFDGMQASLEQAGLRVLNTPNLLKQNFWTSRLMPSSEVISEDITIPAETAAEAAEDITHTITNEAITSSYVLAGVKSRIYAIASMSNITCEASAGSAVITIGARNVVNENATAHDALTITVYICTMSAQNVPYGNASRISGSTYPYLKSISGDASYPGQDNTDGVTVAVADLASADQITEPDGEVYTKALQYNITANTAYGNIEWLQYYHPNYQSGYYEGNTPRNYGHIDELTPGETYTVSFWARVISGNGAWARFGWGGNYGNAPYTDNDKMGRSDWVVIEGAEWKRYSWTFTFNPQGTWYTETSEQKTVNGETKTYITRTYAWNKTVWFGIGRKFTSVVQLCGFRLVHGKLFICETYDDIQDDLTALRERATALETTAEGIPGSISDAKASVLSNIAASDTETATAAHAVGEPVIVGDVLYRVISAIATGETIAAGTNVERTTVMAQIAAMIAAMIDDTAGDGDTAKVYSADKVHDLIAAIPAPDLSAYAPKASPEFTGSIKLGKTIGEHQFGRLAELTKTENGLIDPDEFIPNGSTHFVKETTGGEITYKIRDTSFSSPFESDVAECTLTEGETYTFSFEYGSEDISSGAQVKVRLHGDSNSDQMTSTTTIDGKNYRYTTFTAPANVTGIGIYINRGPSNYNSIEITGIKNVRLVKGSNMDPEAAITIGSTTITETQLQALLAGINSLPAVSASDNGKVLRVSSGAWAAESLPSASGVSF